jgi:hypothetical protein
VNLDYSPEELAFRDEVRAFIAAEYPPELRAKQDAGEELDDQDFLSWHRILAKRGWSAPAWPVEYGGPGLTQTQRFLMSEEMAAADTAPILPFGVHMVGPVIYTFGTPEQKARWLPPTLAGDIWWCQGYSEPGAGSDLASLKTRAVRSTDAEGEHYIVNGQKAWTTLAQFADWGFFLVRTDPDAKPQQGISFLLIDMKSPGITVRPIITLDGSHEVNEVWLEDVRVPVENRIFKENEGWTCAKFLLAHERTGIAGVARAKRGLEKLRKVAAAEGVIDDPVFAAELADLEIDLLALEYSELRTLARESSGKGPGPESSLLKIKGTEIQQRLTEMTVEALGSYALPDARGLGNVGPVGPDYAGRIAPTYFNMRKVSIFGGSNEIQRNIIAKMVLGL